MSAVAMPDALPEVVLREGFQGRIDSPLDRTEMDDGAFATRRRHARIRTIHAVTWELTAGQFGLFSDFFAEDLDAGHAWFLAPVAEGLRIRAQEARFAADPPYTWTQPAPGYFHVAAELELRDLPRLTRAERFALEIWLEPSLDIDQIAADLTAINVKLADLPTW